MVFFKKKETLTDEEVRSEIAQRKENIAEEQRLVAEKKEKKSLTRELKDLRRGRPTVTRIVGSAVGSAFKETGREAKAGVKEVFRALGRSQRRGPPIRLVRTAPRRVASVRRRAPVRRVIVKTVSRKTKRCRPGKTQGRRRSSFSGFPNIGLTSI